MTSSDPARDVTADDDGTDDSDDGYGDAHYALAGGMLCIGIVAVLLGGLFLTRSSPHASGDVPAFVTPTTQIDARQVTPVTRARPATTVKKHPRTTPPSTAPPAVVTPATTPPATAPRPVIVRVRTRPRQPVVQTESVPAQPPTTQPPTQVVVPYSPPTPPGGGVQVPVSPTTTPSR